jgi:hypothetical protein
MALPPDMAEVSEGGDKVNMYWAELCLAIACDYENQGKKLAALHWFNRALEAEGGEG